MSAPPRAIFNNHCCVFVCVSVCSRWSAVGCSRQQVASSAGIVRDCFAGWWFVVRGGLARTPSEYVPEDARAGDVASFFRLPGLATLNAIVFEGVACRLVPELTPGPCGGASAAVPATTATAATATYVTPATTTSSGTDHYGRMPNVSSGRSMSERVVTSVQQIANGGWGKGRPLSVDTGADCEYVSC